ncbi:hypothetical protein [Nocardioides cavernaquae]|uniref:Uncharacterized protein n=1 Tax=Nocardioides cavernaquae TaxID=2321396 RepID=A0A3A5H4Q7_9ACTN|nr:hypothetical protein [Nocardioides cavernaquae]RJS45696.1 hypothetical protein D4739_05315 [Nocardioides cavernaquae]
MKFTEREMTVGIDIVAQRMHAALRGPFRKRDAAAAWEGLAAFAKDQRRAAVGEAVIPALLALPERPTVGATPEFTAAEYEAAAEESTRSLLEVRKPGAWEDLSEKKRTRLTRATAALTRSVVEAMPLRQDPDALIVPDDLGGLS